MVKSYIKIYDTPYKGITLLPKSKYLLLGKSEVKVQSLEKNPKTKNPHKYYVSFFLTQCLTIYHMMYQRNKRSGS